MSAKVITVSNQTGGTGKSTIAFNLSHELANQGYRVLAVDLDPKSVLTSYFGKSDQNFDFTIKDLLIKSTVYWKASVYIHKNLHLIPSDDTLLGIDYHLMGQPFSYMQLKRKLEPAKQEMDFLIIDTPPYFNLFTVNAWNFSDCIIAPFLPDMASLEGLSKLIKLQENIPINIHFVINQSNSSNTFQPLLENTIHTVFKQKDEKILSIPESGAVLDALFHNQPVSQFKPGDATTGSFMHLAELAKTPVKQ